MDTFIYNFLISFPTIILFFVIAAMLYILSEGADMLVDQAVDLSLHLGIPKIVIGATIVSLGTTLPEASVSVLAAINGNPDLALGNAVGSVIANTGLVIGVAALIGALPVSQFIVRRQGKIKFLSGLLLVVVSLPIISGSNIAQWVGWVFVGLLIIYLYTSMKWTQNASTEQAAAAGIPAEDITVHSDVTENDASHGVNTSEEKINIIVKLLKLFFGIFLVIGASKVLIPSVEISATRIGIPQSIIAATLVAFGTSLPELITAVTAVRKGHGELAVGNVVGADILNVLFVVGSAAAVTPGGLDVPTYFYKLQFPTMIIILAIFRLFSLGKSDEEITKKEGLILLSIYVIYLVLNYTWV